MQENGPQHNGGYYNGLWAAESFYGDAEGDYTECRFAVSRYAKCRGAHI